MYKGWAVRSAFAAGLMAIASVGASAATIDFTSASTGTSGSAAGGTWTLTTNVGTLTNAQAFDGQGSDLSSTGLALQRDGYGVQSAFDAARNDDELTAISGGQELVTLTFSKAVRLLSFSFLDLFLPPNGGNGEVGYAMADDGTILSAFGTDLANTNGSLRAGYASAAGGGIITKSIRFYVGIINDTQGRADGALASVDVAPVPVPAAGMLLIGALGGLAMVRRRKATA